MTVTNKAHLETLRGSTAPPPHVDNSLTRFRSGPLVLENVVGVRVKSIEDEYVTLSIRLANDRAKDYVMKVSDVFRGDVTLRLS